MNKEQFNPIPRKQCIHYQLNYQPPEKTHHEQTQL